MFAFAVARRFFDGLRFRIFALWIGATSLWSFIVNLPLVLLLWIFFPLENDNWRIIRRRVKLLYPQIDFNHPRPLDFLRVLIQSLFLVFFNTALYFDVGRQRKLSATRFSISVKHSLRRFKKSAAVQLKHIDRILTEYLPQRPSNIKRMPFVEVVCLILLAVCAVTLLVLCVTQPLDPLYQGIFCAATVSMAFLLRSLRSHVTVILLILLSLTVSTRYMWWRYTETINFDSTAGILFSVLLVLAESYTFVLMLLSYFQTFWVLPRKPVELPEDRSLWPHVDVCIPTYNEPLDVVRASVYGALSLDWPKEKLHVWILDDGNREEFRQFAEHSGAGYIIREQHNHAKAGNINHALGLLKSDFVAIFDCDHIPVHSFLTKTMGWLVRDDNCAMVQTPHYFYSPDPFERNLHLSDSVPLENTLFHVFIQKGNDLWNATMFCGSCAVMRRKAIDEIGGIAVETVTEDAHTSLKFYRKGWNAAFIDKPLAAGLATETLASHIGQRIRWARGMIQIFRLDNPLLGKGLTLGQRLCFLSAMIYFLLGIPRIIFLIAPLPYVYFEINVINASGLAILAFVLPHLLHSLITSDAVQRGHRVPLMGEIYDTILSFYIVLPTTVALIAPHLGKFNVTSKGSTVRQQYLDWFIAKPYVFFFLLNLGGVFVLLVRAASRTGMDSMTLLFNLIWLGYNLVLLGAATSVAVETAQERHFARIKLQISVAVKRADGSVFSGLLHDFSQGGASLRLHPWAARAIGKGERIKLMINHEGVLYEFPAQVMRSGGGSLGIQMHFASSAMEQDFVSTTFCRSSLWENAAVKPSTGLFAGVRPVLHYAWQGFAAMCIYSPAPIAFFFTIFIRLIYWIISFFPRFPRNQTTR